MPIQTDQYHTILASLNSFRVRLVAVSKTKSVDDIRELYTEGQRDFGENYVQELVDKQTQLPPDIRWHFIGHLQSNKVKFIAPFVHLIQSVDSEKLLVEIDKQAMKRDRIIDCLLQVHIAREETKFGLDEDELKTVFENAKALGHIRIVGLMGMASFTDDTQKIHEEFGKLKFIYDGYPGLSTLSMGMSNDYHFAIVQGSNMVRIGSLIFGSRS